MLSHSRYQIDTIADALEAMRVVAKLPYDLILMGIRMPIMGGVEATRRIRALGCAAGQTPIIALTANARDVDVAEYYAIEAAHNAAERPVPGLGQRLGASLVLHAAAK